MTKTGFIKNFLQHFREDKNKLEWLVFFGGIILLLAAITYLALQWSRHEKEEVSLSVSWEPDQTVPSRYELTLSNAGTKSVKEVQLTATCTPPRNAKREETTILIDLAPRRSAVKAWFQFRDRVMPDDSIQVFITSYQ